MTFVALPSVTALNVLFNIHRHAWPPVVSGQKFLSLPSTRVACKAGVVVEFEQFKADIVAFWYVDFASSQKESVFKVPLLQLFPNFPGPDSMRALNFWVNMSSLRAAMILSNSSASSTVEACDLLRALIAKNSGFNNVCC